MKKDESADRLIRMAISLSREKDAEALLGRVLGEAARMAGCSGGMAFLREEGTLRCKSVMIRGEIKKEDFSLSLEENRLCVQAVRTGRPVRLADAYKADGFDLSEIRQYDNLGNCRTGPILALPLGDQESVCVGALYLMDPKDEVENAVFFEGRDERALLALCSLAAVSLNNNLLEQSIIDILHSFVSVMVEAIDARSPYNAKHTRSMVGYAIRFLDWLDQQDRGWRFAPEEKDPFLMSVWLHDLGKLVIPLEIMDKKTRLGQMEEKVLHRIETAGLMEKLRALEHPCDAKAAAEQRERLAWARETLLKISHQTGELTDGQLEEIAAIAAIRCLTAEGREVSLLTPEEREAISVRRGTLTTGERGEIQRHVVYTRRLLDKMRFSGIYQPVPDWASAHHELMDGSGYPHHLTGKDLPRPVRLLTILDIYDALTADDRPYKPPVQPEEAFSILEGMAAEGKLDGEILSLFRKSGAWIKTGNKNGD